MFYCKLLNLACCLPLQLVCWLVLLWPAGSLPLGHCTALCSYWPHMWQRPWNVAATPSSIGVIPVRLLNGYRDGRRHFTIMLVILVCSGKCQTNLFSHLHGWLQVDGFLGTYPGLDVGEKPSTNQNRASTSFTLVHWVYRSEKPTIYSVTLLFWFYLARACLILKA